jgi:hypothetical protein
MAGQKDEGLRILERSKQGFIKLGRQDLAGQVDELIEQFNG